MKKRIVIFVFIALIAGCIGWQPNRAKAEVEQSWITGTEYYGDMDYIGIGLARTKHEDFNSISSMTPLFQKGDNYIVFFYFTVVGRTDKFLEIRTDRKTTRMVSVEDYEFVTWEELLTKHIVGIAANDYYLEKDTSGKKEELSNIINESGNNYDGVTNLIIPQKMEGDWIQVEWRDFSGDDSVVKGTYWVPWRNESGQLLIEIYFLV